MSARILCDRAQALACAGGAARRPRLVLAATILASSLDFIDGSVVNVGLPAIGRNFGGQAADLQWVVNAYLLPLSALLLLGGALGDRFGRRRLFVIGIALFGVGSAACAAAPSLLGLIGARVAQGLAASLMLPNSLAILGDSFEGRERSRSVGIWAASGSIGAAIGPVLGGWLIDQVGWRAIFLINLPLAAAAAALALVAIPRGKSRSDAPSLDIGGASLVTFAVTGLTWGLTQGAGEAGWTAAALAAIAAGVVLLGGFIALEARLGARAMTPLALFGSRPLVALNLLTLLLYGVLVSFMLLLPFLLITDVGYSATAAGAALLPFPLVMGVFSPLLGDLAGRIGARWPLIVGALLVAAGALLATLAPAHGPYVLRVLPCVVAAALGMAFAAAPLTAAVLGAVDKDHTGAASGLNSAVAQLGGVVAVALIGAVLAQKGAGLAGAFRLAAVLGAVVAACAAAVIAVLYRPQPRRGGARRVEALLP